MKIKFISEITHGDGKQDKIEFASPVSLREENGMKVFEFEEPQNKVMNWIEVSENIVNIITGPATINLQLNKELQVEYTTPVGSIYFTSYMDTIKIEDKKVYFTYSLSQGQKTIGKYKITLEIN